MTTRLDAVAKDKADGLAHFRSLFHVPRHADIVDADRPASLSHDIDGQPIDPNELSIYFCGNSLGLQPLSTRTIINEELDVWQTKGVHGHFNHPHNRPWASIEDLALAQTARIVMGSLTANLHFLMTAFYQPTETRYKILIERKAFPSDHYAVYSHLKARGYDPEDAMITLAPRQGEDTLRDEDILDYIRANGSSIALILFSGVQYYTGQLFDMEAITRVGHEQVVASHATGNVPLHLHDWDVDFAAWCSYKYLNSGPGSISGIFVHQRHAHDLERPRLVGWWANRLETRFQMRPELELSPGAAGFQQSNPCVLAVVSYYASLQVFAQTSMKDLRKKSVELTNYLEFLLKSFLPSQVQIITPSDPKRRGCQLSLLFKRNVNPIFDALIQAGIVCDKREPDVIRVAPVPLYNTFEDVWKFATRLSQILKSSEPNTSAAQVLVDNAELKKLDCDQTNNENISGLAVNKCT